MSLPGEFFSAARSEIFQIRTKAPGPTGSLPLTAEMLRDRPSGDIFGLTQNAGMGWDPSEAGRKPFLILSTQGGVRAPDGKPVALGYHTGHWEIGLLVEAAARELKRLGVVPFAAYCSDPCDGRTQGTDGMFDSLPYRNDAAMVFRRLIRSLPVRAGVLGVATCDKGLPAMMMALAGMKNLPSVLVPGGVTLPPSDGEDAGKIQTIGARFSHGMISLQEAADLGCRACASPGGGCQFLGTAATSQVVGEALGMSLPHSALAPSGQPVWTDLAVQSAKALVELEQRGLVTGVDPGRDIAGRGRSAGHVVAALGARAVGTTSVDGPRGAIGEGARGVGAARIEAEGHRHGWKHSERDGDSRSVRWLDEFVAARSGHRARGGTAPSDGGGLD